MIDHMTQMSCIESTVGAIGWISRSL